MNELLVALRIKKIISFLGGMMSYSASVMPYISETVHPSIRGSLATLPAFMMSAGMVMVWIIAYFLTWRMTAYLLVIPPILLFLLMALLPGPKYLGFFSSCFLKTRKIYISFDQLVRFAQFVFFLREVCLSFKKMKSKHTSLKVYTY